MCTAIDLIRKNNCRNFVILERSSGIGGTWRDNLYPGMLANVSGELHEVTISDRLLL